MTFDETLLEFDTVRQLVRQRCVCGMGRRRADDIGPTANHAVLAEAIGLVREMMRLLAGAQEPPIRGMRDASAHLKKVAKQRSVLEPEELLELRDFCQTAGEMRVFFEPLQTGAAGLHALAMPLNHLPGLVRSISEKINADCTVRDSASELLQSLRADIRTTEERIQNDLNRMVRELAASGDLQDDFFTMRNGRYVLPVKTSNRGRVPGIIHDSSNTEETVFIEPFAILEQTNRLADLRLREREEIFRILLRIAGHVRDEMNPLLTNEEILSEFDLIFAKASFGVANQCAFPSLTGMDKPISLIDAHHPILFARDPKGSRPLNIALDTADRVLVITGPNAGGKTTALKTTGLTALMIQSAIPAPLSSRSRMPVFAHVLADIGDEQNILQGMSTFSAHIRRIAEILRAADNAALVLLDELGTATDPGEGGALAVAILEALASRDCLVMVSTHLGVLKNWAFSYPHGRNASFRLSDKDHRPTFRLSLDLPGISEALVVAEQAGLPPDIIARAKSLRPEGEGDATAMLLSLQEKESKIAEELDAAEKLRWELEIQKSEYESLEARLKEEKRKFRAEMLAEKDRALTEMRSKVETMIARLPSKQELLAARQEIAEQNESVIAERAELKKETAAPTLGGHIQAGDRVLVKSLNDEGIVKDLLPKRGEARVYVKKMTVSVKLGDLERLASPIPESSGGGVHFRRPQDMDSTLDLHGRRLEDAIERTEKFLDRALVAGFAHVRIMHGQGSGALARGLHNHLKKHPVVKTYRFGTSAEGGGSVTIVEFK